MARCNTFRCPNKATNMRIGVHLCAKCTLEYDRKYRPPLKDRKEE